MPLGGFCQPVFEPVREAFADQLESGADLGASICITRHGETVVDLWGGWADAARTQPWEKDTLVCVYSTTKTMTALTALLLADRGELDLDAPVARYWPAFAAEGKAGVKVRHVLSHSAGLPGWREPLIAEDIYDWEKLCTLLANQPLDWEPGTAVGYHAQTQGYIVGEVVRRITGRTIGTFFRDEIAGPLGADFHIGLPASEDRRVAQMIPPEGAPRGGSPPLDPTLTRTRGWLGAEIPAAGGTGNARSIAEVHMILANGGVAKGRRFMSEAGCRRALELEVEGVDRAMGVLMRWGPGFGLRGEPLPAPSPNTIYWGGYGGSLSVIDMDEGTTFAYAMNRMEVTTTGDRRSRRLARAFWRSLGLSEWSPASSA